MNAETYRAYDELLSEGVMVPFAFVTLCEGDWHAAAMLAQIRFWMRNGLDGTPRAKLERDGFRWIVRNHSDWERELGLSAHQAKRTAATLLGLGLIVAVQTLYNGKRAILYRSDDEAIAKALFPNGVKVRRSNGAKSHGSNRAKSRGSGLSNGAEVSGSNGALSHRSSTFRENKREINTPADAGDAQARVAAPLPATRPPAAEPAATTPQRALFAAVCAAGGWSPKDLTRGSREQLGQLVATLLTTPEAERPDADQLRATYQAELAALSARLGRRAQALTPVQFREVVGRWIAANRQEAADRQRLAEKALREAEDAARRRQERAAAEAAGPGLAHEGHEAWGRIARELRSRMSPATWASWLADAQPLALQDGVLTIQVASSYAVDWITQRLAAPLASLTEELGLEDLRFVPQELAREVRAA